jgi:hypothetical protein
MTNEEIRKYVKGLYRRKIIQILILWLLGSIGLWIACAVSGMSYRLDTYQSYAIVGIFILTIIKWCVAVYQIDKIDSKIRDLVYYLVRQDERKRCMTKMERYNKEGSK